MTRIFIDTDDSDAYIVMDIIDDLGVKSSIV